MKFGDVELLVLALAVILPLVYKAFFILLGLVISESGYKRLKSLMKLQAKNRPLGGIVRAIKKWKK